MVTDCRHLALSSLILAYLGLDAILSIPDGQLFQAWHPLACPWQESA
jgi:hypothetical protein